MRKPRRFRPVAGDGAHCRNEQFPEASLRAIVPERWRYSVCYRAELCVEEGIEAVGMELRGIEPLTS